MNNSSLKTIDGFDAHETLNHLENGGSIISEKRGDIAKFVDGKFLLFFFIGNRLSKECVTFNLDYLSTFKFVEEPNISTPKIKVIEKNENSKLPLTFQEVKELAVKKLNIYRIGWEMDNTVWVMRDGSMFSTNHGSLCTFSKQSLSDYIDEIKLNLIECSEVVSITE